MAPSDIYLFPKLKSNLPGTQNESKEGVMEAANEYLGDQEKPFSLEGIRKLEQRWTKFIALQGVILKSKGQIFVPWKPEVQSAKTFFITPRIYKNKTSLCKNLAAL